MAASRRAGLAAALTAAIFFGATNAIGRNAVASVHPIVLVAAAYALAGLGLLWSLRGARFSRRELGGAVVVAAVGGAVAPLLFYTGLTLTTAVNASLLLMSEIVFTTAFAVVFLRERLNRREWIGSLLLLAGAILIGVGAGGFGGGALLGNALVVAAAICWSVDNALSTKLSETIPAVRLVAVKGLVGGALVLAVALALRLPIEIPRAQWPHALFIGLVGIGLSTILFYVALGAIGAARTTMIFATSGFFGAVAGVVALREPFGAVHGVAAVLLAAGLVVLFGFRPAPTVPGEKPA